VPRFVYKAKDGPGRTVEGELDAESRSTAVTDIDAMGYSPVWVREKSVDSTGDATGFRIRRIYQRDITVFTRQLASLTKAGVPILRALSTIRDQSENLRFRRVVEDLADTVRDGNMLSGALSKHPVCFSELYVSMVHSGESAGILDEILLRLADAREKEEEMKRKVQSAVAYPMLIVFVGMATVFVLLVFFLPRVVDLFNDYQDLPLPTRILIGTSNFFSDYWRWMALAVFLLVAVFNRLASLDTGKTFFDRIKLHTPLLKRFILDSDIGRFARTLSLLIEAGIPIEKALNLSANTLRNKVLRDEIEKVREDTVRQGMLVSAGLRRSVYFPVFVSNMTAVGEEAGSMEESLDEIASFYEREIERLSRLAVSLLEPVLILVVGVIVGFIVTAMLLPIFEIGKAL